MVNYMNGAIEKLFNTSGADYRALDLKRKMHLLSEGQKIDLLARNGNLVKRPFVIGKGFGLVGFREEQWQKRFR